MIILLFDVTDLDDDSKRRIFQYFIIEYKYAHEKSTAYTFGEAKMYEVNMLTKEIKTFNRTFSYFSKDSYCIKVKK